MYFKKYICLFFTGALMTVSTDCAFTDQGPAASLAVDFADPSVIQAHGRWYAFGTNNNGVHVQLASSSDFDNWELWNSYDALPNLPDWVHPDRSDIWAPNVVQVVCVLLNPSSHGTIQEKTYIRLVYGPICALL